MVRKPGIMFAPPSVVEQCVKLKSGLDLEKFTQNRVAGTSESLGARARLGRRV